MSTFKNFFNKITSCFKPNVKQESTIKRDLSCGDLLCLGLSATTMSEILDYKETDTAQKSALGKEKERSERPTSPEAQKLREKLLAPRKEKGLEIAR